jgi:hypothetical protein
VRSHSDSSHPNRRTSNYRRARARLDQLSGPSRDGAPLHPQHVAATIDDLAAADAVFTADVGTPLGELELEQKRRRLEAESAEPALLPRGRAGEERAPTPAMWLISAAAQWLA